MFTREGIVMWVWHGGGAVIRGGLLEGRDGGQVTLVSLVHLCQTDLEGVSDGVQLLLKVFVYFRVPLVSFELKWEKGRR